jgi:uncharacterized repeat protein (TIGR01451 family)
MVKLIFFNTHFIMGRSMQKFTRLFFTGLIALLFLSSIVTTPTSAASLSGQSMSGVPIMDDPFASGQKTSHNPGTGSWTTNFDDPGPTGPEYGRWGCNTDPNTTGFCGFGDNNYRAAYQLDDSIISSICSAAKINSITVNSTVSGANKNQADTDGVWIYSSLDSGATVATVSSRNSGSPLVAPTPNNYTVRGYGIPPTHSTLATTSLPDNGELEYTLSGLNLTVTDLEDFTTYVWHEQSGGGSNYDLLTTVTTTAPEVDITYDDSECTRSSDLSAVKTIVGGSSSVSVGDEITFDIVIKNDGPDDATNVQSGDPVPEGLSYISSSASSGEYDPLTGIWTIPNLPNGATSTLSITLKVDSISDTGIENIVEITASDSDDPDSTTGNCDKGAELEDDCSVVKVAKKEAPIVPKTGTLVGAGIATMALIGMVILGARELINNHHAKASSEK